MRGSDRLDDELWRPSVLGCVGPGLLGALAVGGDRMYRPLLALHLDPDLLDDPPTLGAEIVDGDESWDRLCADPEVQMATGGRGGAMARHPGAVVVVVRSRHQHRTLRAVLAVRPDTLDPRVAAVTMVWTPSHVVPSGHPDQRDVLTFGWLALFAEAARRGIVGLTADVDRTGARDVQRLVEVAGFRRAADCYAEVGLGATEAGIALDRWRATVVDDEVTVLATRSSAEGAARRELVARLARLLPDRPAAAVDGGYRMGIRGAVTLDGCSSWGAGSAHADDWTSGGGIEIDDMDAHDRAWHRSVFVLREWCRAEVGI